MSQLYNAISGAEYDKISKCETAKEMQDNLKVTCEGTNKVKEAQISSFLNERMNMSCSKWQKMEMLRTCSQGSVKSFVSPSPWYDIIKWTTSQENHWKSSLSLGN